MEMNVVLGVVVSSCSVLLPLTQGQWRALPLKRGLQRLFVSGERHHRPCGGGPMTDWLDNDNNE